MHLGLQQPHRRIATLVEEAIGKTGAVPKEVSDDAGYYSVKKVEGTCLFGVDTFIAAEKTRHGTKTEPAPRAGCPVGCLPKAG